MTTPVSESKDLEVGDRDWHLAQGRIEVEGRTEGGPEGQVACRGTGGRRNDAGDDILLRKAEIAEERMALDKGYSSHGCLCG